MSDTDWVWGNTSDSDSLSSWEKEVITQTQDYNHTEVILTPHQSTRVRTAKKCIVAGGAFLLFGIAQKILKWALDL